MQNTSIRQDFVDQEIGISLFQDTLEDTSYRVNKSSNTYLKLLGAVIDGESVSHPRDTQAVLSCNKVLTVLAYCRNLIVVQLNSLQRTTIAA